MQRTEATTIDQSGNRIANDAEIDLRLIGFMQQRSERNERRERRTKSRIEQDEKEDHDEREAWAET